MPAQLSDLHDIVDEQAHAGTRYDARHTRQQHGRGRLEQQQRQERREQEEPVQPPPSPPKHRGAFSFADSRRVLTSGAAALHIQRMYRGHRGRVVLGLAQLEQARALATMS